jgi:Protein of unknown function (DUF2934)
MAPYVDRAYVAVMTHTHHSHHPQNGEPATGHMSASAKHSNPDAIKDKPSHDEVARKAYAIYQKESCPQGCAVKHWLQAEAQMLI